MATVWQRHYESKGKSSLRVIKSQDIDFANKIVFCFPGDSAVDHDGDIHELHRGALSTNSRTFGKVSGFIRSAERRLGILDDTYYLGVSYKSIHLLPHSREQFYDNPEFYSDEIKNMVTDFIMPKFYTKKQGRSIACLTDEEAIKQASTITFFTNSHGGVELAQACNAIKTFLGYLQYDVSTTKNIMRNMAALNIAPAVQPDYTHKITTVNIYGRNDKVLKDLIPNYTLALPIGEEKIQHQIISEHQLNIYTTIPGKIQRYELSGKTQDIEALSDKECHHLGLYISPRLGKEKDSLSDTVFNVLNNMHHRTVGAKFDELRSSFNKPFRTPQEFREYHYR